jgi:hypothetical protein
MIPLLGTYIELLKLNKRAMSDLVKIYSDTEITVTHLKNRLADNGIESMIKNDFESGVSAGFVAGAPNSVELYVMNKDLERAQAIIEQFKAELKK